MGHAAIMTTALERTVTRSAAVFLPRLVLCAAMVAGIVAGFVATDPSVAAHAASEAGADLTRLLRAMALLKALMAIAAAAAVVWRARAPIGAAWCGAYALSLGTMAAGPGLIWSMAHVALGALLLHGGLIATALLLWRDPAVGTRLAAAVAVTRRRRAAP